MLHYKYIKIMQKDPEHNLYDSEDVHFRITDPYHFP